MSDIQDVVSFQCPGMRVSGTVVNKRIQENGEWFIKVQFGEDEFEETSHEFYKAGLLEIIKKHYFSD